MKPYLDFFLMKILLFSLLFLLPVLLQAQLPPQEGNGEKQVNKDEQLSTTTFGGRVVKILISNGDTIPVVAYDPIEFSFTRNFDSRDERKRYHQWRAYAIKVYPYAAEAIRIYRKTEAETKGMNKRQRKKYTKEREKDIKLEYEDKLKKLTKTQGYILIKMVERELEQPFYKVISELRGGWSAFRWQSVSRWYGYNLKDGYNPADDPILESILKDLNISYEYDLNAPESEQAPSE